MATLKKVNPKIPNVLVAVAVTILISKFTGFNHDSFVPIENIKDLDNVFNSHLQLCKLIRINFLMKYFTTQSIQND